MNPDIAQYASLGGKTCIQKYGRNLLVQYKANIVHRKCLTTSAAKETDALLADFELQSQMKALEGIYLNYSTTKTIIKQCKKRFPPRSRINDPKFLERRKRLLLEAWQK